MIQLKKDDINKRVYRISNGETITMILDNEEYRYIQFFNSQNEQIGLFEFEPLSEYSSDYKLKYMHLDLVDNKYKDKHLGTTALIFFKEMTNSNIYTSPYDGQQRDDGSHLTGDAIRFVAKMKQKGLISGDYPFPNEDGFNNGFIDL